MIFQKIVGWILLIMGVAIILYALYSSFNIFTGVNLPPEIFKIAEKETTVLQKGSPQDLQAQMEKLMGEQLKGMLPVDFLPKLFNLIVWAILAGILMFGGFHIAGLGIRLIKQ